MYCEGLAFTVVDEFEDHDGFDGVMIGASGGSYHIEFTKHRARPVVPTPTVEDLLVFYIPSAPEWRDACERMRRAGFRPARPHNPYWQNCACMFADHDGYHVALHRGAWTPEHHG
jgi:YycE-like C-terminal domain/YycE-like N-terminal domain